MTFTLHNIRESTPRLHIFTRRPSDNARAIKLLTERINELNALQAACHVFARAERIDELNKTLNELRRIVI